MISLDGGTSESIERNIIFDGVYESKVSFNEYDVIHHKIIIIEIPAETKVYPIYY